MRDTHLLRPDFACKHIIDMCPSSNYQVQELKPVTVEKTDYVDELYESMEIADTIKVVQFTDAHVDLDY